MPRGCDFCVLLALIKWAVCTHSECVGPFSLLGDCGTVGWRVASAIFFSIIIYLFSRSRICCALFFFFFFSMALVWLYFCALLYTSMHFSLLVACVCVWEEHSLDSGVLSGGWGEHVRTLMMRTERMNVPCITCCHSSIIILQRRGELSLTESHERGRNWTGPL